MANPTALNWTGSTQREDGSPFTRDQFKGFTLEISRDGTVVSSFSVPNAWEDDNEYTMPLSLLGLGFGTFSVRMKVTDTQDNDSQWTNPLQIVLLAPPARPTNLAVA